jgi:hypothetical protein
VKKKKKTSKEVLGVFFLLSCYFSFLEVIKYGNTFLQKVWTNLTSSGVVHAHIKFVCGNDIMIAFFSIDPSLLEPPRNMDGGLYISLTYKKRTLRVVYR